MPRGNPDKLIHADKLSQKEASEMGRKGGIASVKARREKKLMTAIYADLLADKYEVTINGEKVKIDGAKLVQSVARDVLMRRDSSSVSLMKEIREATEGNKLRIGGLNTDPIPFEYVSPVKKNESSD